MISGAQIMVKCLENEGVSVVFGYPGAAICPFYDCLYDSPIRHVLVRQEQNAGHAASGYARVSGKVGVCVVTSGPGATNLITALATAYMDSIPIVAITGQVRSDLLGRDVFQEVDITGACEPFTKHSYLVSDTADLPRIFKEAFHIASTGRPGPVLIDIPVDMQTNTVESFTYPEKAEIIGYKPRSNGHPLQVIRAAELLAKAKRPVICAGGGIVAANARKELMRFVEKTQIPVVSTMMGIGIFPSDHPQYLGMLGSHGVYAANRAIYEADLLILCGARVGDRALAKPDQITEKAKVIHIDIDPAEIGKNMKADIPIVGDIRLVLAALTEKAESRSPQEWLDMAAEWKLKNMLPEKHYDGYVNPKRMIREMSARMARKAVYVADVGQNQIWSANNFQAREGRFLTTGGLGTMGYSIPAAIGAKLAKPHRQVVAVCGDGSFQMSLNELGTICQQNVDIKIVIMRNVRLGMVRELQDNLYGGRHSATLLDGTPDFVKLATAYGLPAQEIWSDEEVIPAIEALLSSKGTSLLVCNVSPDMPSK